MPVVTLSFPEQMIKEVDQAQRSFGFTGRSELVRAAIRLLLQEFKEKNGMSGETSAIIVATHNEENEGVVTQIKHRFDDIVKTHLHTKTGKKNCVELFVLDGDASKITTMLKEFQREDKIRSVKLVTM